MTRNSSALNDACLLNDLRMEIYTCEKMTSFLFNIKNGLDYGCQPKPKISGSNLESRYRPCQAFFFWLISPTNILSGVRPIFFYKKIYRSICPNHPILFYQYILNNSCQLEKQKYPWKNSNFFNYSISHAWKKTKIKINWGLLEHKSHNWNNFFPNLSRWAGHLHPYF